MCVRARLYTHMYVHFSMNTLDAHGVYSHVSLTYNEVLTEIPTIIDPSATINYPSATGSIIVGISVVR